ncbi:sensor histidine kinase [Nocardioides zhouii]|uniref:histidine kinase n=1 Tax=Nocardioides zhouii TaxID=1168729 RepID=A0A4V1RNX9_9ACTN|nr:HAMP domain-containing sensor histidine kinase [Nocardioides zhouii]RYC07417.1 HAMP domain-containing histidine kinase [Nocardioides zhouii]
MIEHPALQDVSAGGPVSGEAAALAARIMQGEVGVGEAIGDMAAHLLADSRVEIVVAALTRVGPEDEDGWRRLGGRAWVREWSRPWSTTSLLPPPGAGAEAAQSMPWLSQFGRRGTVVLVDRELLPPEADQDRSELGAVGIRSVAATSFSARGEMFGSLSAASIGAGLWPQTLVDDLRLLTSAVTARLALEQSRRALAEAIDAGAEAQEGYQQFFAAVGHELRTPLAAITGYTEVLLDDAAQAPDGPVAEALLRDGPVILRASEQLVAVVDSLLGAGRALASDDTRQDVGVADALADVVHWHRATALAAHVEIFVDVDPELTVWAHASGVRQVLANLLGNAITHHRADGGTVRLSASGLLGESGQPMVRIIVRDDGPGLDADQLAHAFDPFVRFATRGTQGTGLGLSICRTIAERDGGAVRGISTVGTGSSFWLELPAQQTVAAPGPAT